MWGTRIGTGVRECWKWHLGFPLNAPNGGRIEWGTQISPRRSTLWIRAVGFD